jgi:thioredoxin reductase
MATKTIAIIGAGPVGLAAAAHALERGLSPTVLERGPAAGHAIRQWAHVPMFSPWAFNVDAAAGRLLAKSGWTRPDPDRYPTGGDLVSDYVAPLAEKTALRDRIRFDAEVISGSRVGFDKVKSAGREAAPFLLRYRNGAAVSKLTADAVIDTSGTWFSPNPAGSGGLPAIGESEAAGRISYGMPDILGEARPRYAGRRVAVLGGGHSAIGTLIALANLQAASPVTEITWLYRGAVLSKAFGGGAADQLAARGELGLQIADLVEQGRIRTITGFRLDRIETDDLGLRLTSDDERNQNVAVDGLIVATGFRPDLSLLRELRVELDPALECPPSLAPLIDPNIHSCGTVRPHGAVELAHPEPGFYIAGMKAYGRAPTFLLATGHEQVRSIVAELAGDHAAARRVELVLPETGVCSSTPGGPSATKKSCCGGPAPVTVDACCADDAKAKAAGETGCGCGSAQREARETAEV